MLFFLSRISQPCRRLWRASRTTALACFEADHTPKIMRTVWRESRRPETLQGRAFRLTRRPPPRPEISF